jgi:hypothetical protein
MGHTWFISDDEFSTKSLVANTESQENSDSDSDDNGCDGDVSDEDLINCHKINEKNTESQENSDSDSDYDGDGDESDTDDDDLEGDVSDEHLISCDKFNEKKLMLNKKAQYIANADMTLFEHFETHMLNTLEVPNSAYKTLLGRIAGYIGWLMHEDSVSQRQAVDIIFETPMVFLRYLNVLKVDYKYKWSTVYNLLVDLTQFAEYIEVYEGRSTQAALIVFAKQRKNAGGKKRKEIRSSHTVDKLLEAKKWPAGGMRELQDILLKKQPSVDRIINRAIADEMVALSDLVFVNNWVISMLFLLNPQGRQKAITALSVDNLPELMADGLTTSSEFKTQLTYGYQAITCNALTLKYLALYVKYFRPLLLVHNSAPCFTVFVNTQGKSFQDSGKCLTSFFSAWSSLHITTGTLRSIYETEVEVAQEEGLINAAEAASVIRNNQHSSEVSRSSYLKRHACDAARTSASVHDKLYREAKSFMVSPVFPRATDPPYTPPLHDDDTSDDVYSTPGPPKRRRGRRINWTDDEKSQLQLWVNRYEHSCGVEAKKDWVACCIAMKQTTMFHELHLKSHALRDAWRREQSKKARLV